MFFKTLNPGPGFAISEDLPFVFLVSEKRLHSLLGQHKETLSA